MRANIVKKPAPAPTITISEFGGTAPSYCRYEPCGEPYKKGNAKYIDIKFNNIIKTVRWYTDKAHNDDYPFHVKVDARPHWENFFFTSAEDQILIIKINFDPYDADNAELVSRFRSAGWKFRRFLGCSAIAPKTCSQPDGYTTTLIDWPTLKAEGQRLSSTKEGVWFN